MYKETAFPSSFKWDISCTFKYQSTLTSSKITNLVNNFMSSDLSIDNITDAVHNVTNIYRESAKSCLRMKPKMSHKSKPNKHKPWFNNDLQLMRRELDKIGKVFHEKRNIPEIRRVFFVTLKMYNKKRKIEHRKFTQNMMDQLNKLRTSNPQAYWKLLKNMNNDSANPSDKIKLQEWELYFRNLNKPTITQDDTNIKQRLKELEKTECFNEMDFKLSEKEVAKCMKTLKNNKASGLDGICNEMLKYSQHVMLPVLTKLFNFILLSRKYPRQWCEGYIVPVSKGADITLPSNYRGITILSCLAKLFNTLLNDRISNYLEKRKLLDEKQIGFKKGFRTTDHMFVLRTLIEKYTRNGKLYACFIDFKKAFDSIDHTNLLYKLKQLDISSNIYHLIKDMYVNIGSTLYVKSGGFLSKSFKSYIGLRQGDVLSPNLFKIYLNDLSKYLITNEDTPLLKDIPIDYLLYADALVLLSRNALNRLNDYCNDWKLNINMEKTKIIVFNKSGKLIKNNLNR